MRRHPSQGPLSLKRLRFQEAIDEAVPLGKGRIPAFQTLRLFIQRISLLPLLNARHLKARQGMHSRRQLLHPPPLPTLIQ